MIWNKKHSKGEKRQEMQEEKKRLIGQWLLPIIVLIAIIAAMLFNLVAKSREMAATAVENDMIRVAERYASELYNDLIVMNKSAIPVGLAIAQMEGANTELLTELRNQSPAYMVVYCDKTGQGITHNGEAVDLSREEYFIRLMESGISTYLHIPDDKITGVKAVVHGVNIPDSSEHMLLSYHPIGLGEKIRKNDFDGNFFYVLADRTGNILAQNEHTSNFLSGDNILNALGNQYNDSVRKMTSRLQGGLSGCMEAVIGGEARTLVYTPLGMNQWTVIMGVKQYYVDRQKQEEWEFTRKILLQLVVVVCIFLILLVLINLFSKIRNTEDTKELLEKADTDLLTGLNNKLATERKIKEFMQHNPNEQSMMFVLDIDNFKKINDTMGHAFGDEVLRSLGLQITVMFRITDIVGRTGGDEFIIFLKSIKDEVTLKKEAEKVARFFHGFKTGEYVKYSATASIGVAIFPRDGKDFETIYKAADQALYMAKKRGKNQLAFYHDQLEAVVIK